MAKISIKRKYFRLVLTNWRSYCLSPYLISILHFRYFFFLLSYVYICDVINISTTLFHRLRKNCCFRNCHTSFEINSIFCCCCWCDKMFLHSHFIHSNIGAQDTYWNPSIALGWILINGQNSVKVYHLIEHKNDCIQIECFSTATNYDFVRSSIHFMIFFSYMYHSYFRSYCMSKSFFLLWASKTNFLRHHSNVQSLLWSFIRSIRRIESIRFS